MQNFFKALKLSPLNSLVFENFIYTMADDKVINYTGGAWASLVVDGVTILLLPAQETYTIHTPYTEVSTDRVTASAAFTSLACNWFWNTYHSRMSIAENSAFEAFHYNLRDMVYSDTSTHEINLSDYFKITD